MKNEFLSNISKINEKKKKKKPAETRHLKMKIKMYSLNRK